MKLSTRLSLIVGCAALGTLVLVFVALRTIHSSIVDERKEQIRSMISLTVKQVGVYVALEKAGTLSRDEAQAQANRVRGMADRLRAMTALHGKIKEMITKLEGSK